MKHIGLTLLFLLAMTSMIMSQGWQTLTTGVGHILYDMSFPDGQSQVGYAVGSTSTYDGDGVIIKTTDGGDTWTQISSGTIPGLEAVFFTDLNTGYAGGWQNYFIKTTDGGTNWTQITVDPGVWYFVDIEFWDANNGIALAAGGEVYVTSDAGTNWTSATGISAGLYDLCYATSTTLFAAGGDEKILKSTDGGLSWTEVYSGIFQFVFLGVEFLDANFGYVAGEDGKIMHTTDGGSNWSSQVAGSYLWHAFHIFNQDSTYVAGTPEVIYKTTNGGTTWVEEYSNAYNPAFYKVIFCNDNTGFVCGSQGTMLKKAAAFTADFTASVTEVCEGDAVQFTDNSIGATTWSWTFEGGTPPASSSQNPQVTYNTVGDYDVQLAISNGTSYDTLLQENYIHVSTTAGQPVTPTGPAEACGGSVTEYTTNSVPDADSYEWMVEPSDAGYMSGDGTSSFLMAADNWTGAYTIKVRAVNDCGNSSWSGTIAGTLYHSPEAFWLSEGSGYCEGSPGIEITLSSSETGIDYELYKDDVATGNIVPGTGSAISWGYIQAVGLYAAVGFNDNCIANMNGQAYIFLLPLPEQAATPAGPELVCNYETTTYTTGGSTNADTLTWILTPSESGIMTPNGDEASIAWNENFSGMAYLSVYGENDCGPGDPSDELEITIDECTGIDDPQLSAIKIYPNPAGNVVTVAGTPEMETIILTDISGKHIETVVPSADGETQIDLSGLKTGVYLIKITFPGAEKNFRLMKK